MGFAAPPRQILDGNLRDGRTGPACKCWNKAVQFTIQLQVLHHLTPVRFESGSEIMQLQTAEFCHQPIRDMAGQAAREPAILPLKTPTADDVISLAQFGNERRDFGRIVLEIAVHRNNDFSLSEIEPRLKPGRLPKVFA